MAQKINFYKLNALPASLTPANDGIYFIKSSDRFRMYIVSNGIAIEIDAVTLGMLSALQDIVNTKANDNAVVHLTGDESINGTKSFLQSIVNNVAPTLGSHLTNKAYVDAADNALGIRIDNLANVVATGLKSPKDIDCTPNPNYPEAKVGDTWIVTGKGKIGGSAGIEVEVGDMIICKTNSASGTHADVGSNFFVVQSNLDQATETIAGYAKIATQALTDAGIDDSTIVSPKKLAAKLASMLTEYDARYVRHDAAQSLSTAQQSQARSNINSPSKEEAVLVTGDQVINGKKSYSVAPSSNVDAVSGNDIPRLSQVQALADNASVRWSAEEWT